MARNHLDRIREQYTRQADAYSSLQQTRDEQNQRQLAGLCGAGPKDRALDVACGPGFLTMALAETCGSVVGVDATEALLERARAEAARRGLVNVEFRAGDASALEQEDASFDIVVSRAAFHHFEHPSRVLAEMKRVARPEGRLLIADLIGNEDARGAAYHDAIERLCDPTHVRALPASEFERMFGQAGLTITFRAETKIDWQVETWMAHGGPEPAAEHEIITRMEASLTDDVGGLEVHRDADGRLCFRQKAGVFLLATTR